MGITIDREEDEHIFSLVRRHRRLVEKAYRRNWAKRRTSVYEKASIIRRRTKAIREITLRRAKYGLAPFLRYADFKSQYRDSTI